MENVISNLKKEFHTRVKSQNSSERYQAPSSVSFLTQEELAELENAWVQLIVWKKAQLS
ncbi:hypothetical protein L4C33_17360 [Vibrio makurazakiensis]|uniref:hypothetical protein n=1 Tax=Vibrio makurazakiensis TaxID=2910250 RepID=UPI003D0B582E